MSNITQNQQDTFYGPGDTPPLMLTIFSSIQHVFLIISLGIALPVTIAHTVGLSAADSGSFLSMSLVTIGITSILQSIKTKYFGNGEMDFSISDFAALAVCNFAANIGGMPLVFGMTIFSGFVKMIMGSFTYRFRKLFPPEVTGTMIFILGINIIPTGLKYFLGIKNYTETGVFSTTHLAVASISLLIMLIMTIFSKNLKPYSVLFGMVGGYILSIILGIFDFTAFADLKTLDFFRIPFPKKLEFAFDWRVVIPFIVVTVSSVVDNIGDYSAVQKLSNLKFKRLDWHGIEGGIRSSGLGCVISGLTGGVLQSTATPNLGVARATRVTSRVVVYVSSAILILLAFFPRITGALMLIPEPVLGAVLIFSITYIMAGGFSTIIEVELDDRRVFVIFISIIFAISTMIPSLWVFMPKEIADVLVSPTVMGTLIIMFMTVLMNLGTKRRATIVSSTDAISVQEFNEKIKSLCQEWCTTKKMCNSLMFGFDAVAESLCVNGVDNEFTIEFELDRMQIKAVLTAEHEKIPEQKKQEDDMPDELDLSIIMLKNRFDNVEWKRENQRLILSVDADL